MAQSRFRFDQAPTHVMHDEQLLALVRQTDPNEPLLLPLVAAEESDSVPTALYRTIDVHRIEQERRAAVSAPAAQPAGVATAEAPVARVARPLLAQRLMAVAARLFLLVLVTSGLAYLTWRTPERFGLGFGLAATSAATSPARAVPAAKAR